MPFLPLIINPPLPLTTLHLTTLQDLGLMEQAQAALEGWHLPMPASQLGAFITELRRVAGVPAAAGKLGAVSPGTVTGGETCSQGHATTAVWLRVSPVLDGQMTCLQLIVIYPSKPH
jgi:hypothetical protein